ncbi:pol protein [Thraustotheca clavata]|uniref:Pol protein n=1 Tax=Thraustotheca clavata TaxID=74557 RepID=A0A1V9ZZZ0_9STRA|nr:pol protein [Thraustotheca clavata]
MVIDHIATYCAYESTFKGKSEEPRTWTTHPKFKNSPSQQNNGKPQDKAVGYPKLSKVRYKCLKCGDEYHTTRKCPKIVNRDEATRLVKEAVQKKAALSSGQEEDYITATLSDGNGVPIKTRLDSEAAHFSLKLEITALNNPIDAFTFSGQKAPISRQVILGIALPAGGGSLLLKNMKCHIQEDTLPSECCDLLISKSIMKTLGYDSNELLQKASSKNRVWDLAHHYDVQTGQRMVGSLVVSPMDHNSYDATELCMPAPEPLVRQREEASNILRKQIDKMESFGADSTTVEAIKKMVLEDYIDVFRTTIGLDPPVKAPPMTAKLKNGAEPIKCHVQRLPLAQRTWLRHYCDTMVEGGLLYLNPTSSWASPPFLVKKPGTEDYRLIIDLRGVNACIEDTQWPMPHLDTLTEYLHGAKYFAVFDAFKGYWQFLCELSCQDLFSFMTDHGVYTSNRVPTGGKVSIAHYQSSMTSIFHDMINKNLLVWIDDVFLFASTQESLINVICEFLKRCEAVELKLHPGKCFLFATKVKWCGNVTSGEGIEHDPEGISALIKMLLPKNGADLVQFVCAAYWMRNHIPNFNQQMQPIQDALCRVYAHAGDNKKVKLKKFALEDKFFTNSDILAFDQVKKPSPILSDWPTLIPARQYVFFPMPPWIFMGR